MIPDQELDRVTRQAAARRDAAPRRTNEEIWTRVRVRRAHAQTLWLRRPVIVAGAVAAALVLLLGGIAIGARIERRQETGAMTRETARIIQSHLQQSAAVIGAFRSAVATGTPNEELGSWARHLESVTRQIQATRATHDSTLDALLGDLDYALAQIAAYADVGSNSAAESELIESSVEGRQLVARLRSASAKAGRMADTRTGLAP